MDIQLKRGLLEICVLTVLSKGDSYGYQIIKDIEPCIEISESTLYPILKRLEQGMRLPTIRWSTTAGFANIIRLPISGERG
jgi:PadR family transcriptional regulator PadR